MKHEKESFIPQAGEGKDYWDIDPESFKGKLTKKFLREFKPATCLNLDNGQTMLFGMCFERYVVLNKTLRIRRKIRDKFYEGNLGADMYESSLEEVDFEQIASNLEKMIERQRLIVGESACRVENAANLLSATFLDNLGFWKTRERNQKIKATLKRIQI